MLALNNLNLKKNLFFKIVYLAAIENAWFVNTITTKKNHL